MVVTLWFYLPLLNGSKQPNQSKWERFKERDRARLEEHEER